MVNFLHYCQALICVALQCSWSSCHSVDIFPELYLFMIFSNQRTPSISWNLIKSPILGRNSRSLALLWLIWWKYPYIFYVIQGSKWKNSFYNITLSVRFGWRGRECNLPHTASKPHFNYLRQCFRTSPKQSSWKDLPFIIVYFYLKWD